MPANLTIAIEYTQNDKIRFNVIYMAILTTVEIFRIILSK